MSGADAALEATRLQQVTHPARALAAMSLVSITTFVSYGGVSVSLPDIQGTFDVAVANLSWAQNAYMLAFASLIVMSGRLADIFGHRRILLVGSAIFVAGAVTSAAAPGYGIFLGGRVLQGAAASMMTPASLMIVADAYPAAKRGRAIGIWAGVGASGYAVGAVVGGALVSSHLLGGGTTDAFGWRGVFVFCLLLLAIGTLLTLDSVKRTGAKARKRPLDIAGALTVTLALAAFVFGLVRFGDRTADESLALALLGASVVLFVVFALMERRATDPLVSPALVRNRTFMAGVALTFAGAFAVISCLFLFPLYLQFVLHFSPALTGLAATPVTLTLLVAGPVGGRMVDRLGLRLPMVTGAALLAGGLLILTFLSDRTDYWTGLFPAATLAGIGFGVIWASASASSIASVRPRERGTAAGLVNMSHQVAGVVGVGAITVVFARIADSRLVSVADAARITLSDTRVSEIAGALGSDDPDKALRGLPAGTAHTLEGLMDQTFVYALSRAVWVPFVLVAGIGILAFFLIGGRSRSPALAQAGAVGPPTRRRTSASASADPVPDGSRSR